MNDLQRFLRHVVPGLLFLVLTALYLSLSLKLDNIKGEMDFLNIGVVFTVFFASGAVGFLLSIIHHALFWSCCYKGRIAIHHGKALKDAMAAGHLELCLPNGDLPLTELTRRGAWRAVVSLLHTRTESSKRLKGADRRIGGLSDLVHGGGATFIGSIAAFFAWVIIILRKSSSSGGVDVCVITQ